MAEAEIDNDEKTAQATPVSQNQYWSVNVGVFFALIGGAIGIYLAYQVNHNLQVAWAAILVAWGVSRVNDALRSHFVWRSALRGLLLGVAYVAAGWFSVQTGNEQVLLGLVLAGWLIPDHVM